MKNRITKIEELLLYFTIVDILFAPYLFFLATSYSQFIVFLWFIVKDKKIFNKLEVQLYVAILIFILISTFASFFFSPNSFSFELLLDNFKRGLSVGMAISYYFFFYYFLKLKEIKLGKWFFVFFIYVTVWGIIYFINVNYFLAIKPFFNSQDATLSNLIIDDYLFRFNFIWTDPNNVGYALIGVLVYLIINGNNSNMLLLICIICLIFNLLIIMSAGSIITAMSIIPLALFVRFVKVFKSGGFVMFILYAIIFFFIIYKFSDQFTTSDIGISSLERLERKNETGDSRPIIWKTLIESKNIILYLISGDGANIYINGKPYAPHNGHLFFIYGFGMISYLCYMYLIYRKLKEQKWAEYLIIVPFLVCFTVNIGIGELKYAAIFYLIVASLRVNSIKCSNNKLLTLN